MIATAIMRPALRPTRTAVTTLANMKKRPTRKPAIAGSRKPTRSTIVGESAPIASEARTNWKTACNRWRQEFRDANEDARIINLSCGEAECSGNAGNKTCVSKGTYKIKTRND